MHELSLCRSIHSVVDEARRGREVETIHLRVGQLRQVVPDTLSYCWGLVSDGGPLAGSRLLIEHVPVVLDCRDCAARTTVENTLVLVCAACGSGSISLATGEEFMVTSLDVRPQTATYPTTEEKS